MSDRYARRPCGCLPYMDGSHVSTCPEADSRRRVLTFTGTRSAFLRYLVSTRFLTEFLAEPDEELREWELTASIARHPAGKGLQAGDPS